MKHKIFFTLAFAIFLSLVSCGGDKTKNETETQVEEKLQAEPIAEIKGPLGEYFTVAERPITFKKDGSGYKITVELERNDMPTSYGDDICYFSQGKESEASMCGGFGYEILDESGDVIAKRSPQSAAYGWDEMSLALRTPEGQSNSVTFSIYDLDGVPAKVRIISDLQKNTEKNKSANADKISEVSSSTEEPDVIDKTLQDAYDNASDVVETAKKVVEVEKEALDMLHQLTK